MGSFFKDRKGYALPYSVIVIVLVGMPMMILSVELTRAMYVNVTIQKQWMLPVQQLFKRWMWSIL